MIPKLRPNIYPRTRENVRAIFTFYFPNAKISEIEEATEKYYDDNVYDLSHLEFFAEKITENYSFFDKEFNSKPTVKLMMFYAEEALGKTETELSKGSAAMNRIKSLFRDLVVSKMIEKL